MKCQLLLTKMFFKFNKNGVYCALFLSLIMDSSRGNSNEVNKLLKAVDPVVIAVKRCTRSLTIRENKFKFNFTNMDLSV